MITHPLHGEKDGSNCVTPNQERIEGGVDVKDVHPLPTLEGLGQGGGEGRGQELVEDLGPGVGGDHRQQRPGRDHAQEGHGEEHGAVQGLPHHGADPEPRQHPPSPGADLHPGQDGRVGELPDQISGEGGQQQPGGEAQDLLVGGLAFPEGRGGQKPAGGRGQDGEEVPGEARPDHPAGNTVAVDLGDHVADDVGDREDDHRRGQGEGAEGEELDGDDVGDHQARHEKPHEQREGERGDRRIRAHGFPPGAVRPAAGGATGLADRCRARGAGPPAGPQR
jgi:hypothetical protein